MDKVKVTKIKSAINRPKDQKATLEALGLRKMNQTAEHTLTPQIAGMVRKVSHLIRVEKLEA